MTRSIRYMGVAHRTRARRRRVDLVRELFRRMDAAAAPRRVPPDPPQRDAGGRSTPSP